jgi:hypothetical protein
VEDDGAEAFGLNNPLISGCYIAAPAYGIVAAASYRKVTVAAGSRHFSDISEVTILGLLRCYG